MTKSYFLRSHLHRPWKTSMEPKRGPQRKGKKTIENYIQTYTNHQSWGSGHWFSGVPPCNIPSGPLSSLGEVWSIFRILANHWHFHDHDVSTWRRYSEPSTWSDWYFNVFYFHFGTGSDQKVLKYRLDRVLLRDRWTGLDVPKHLTLPETNSNETKQLGYPP